jgi:hypothetical protein
VLGQLAVAAQVTAHDVGDDFLVGRADDEVAVVAVLEAQQLGAVEIPAAGFLPQLGGLHGGHQHLDGAGTVHFFPDDRLDLAQGAQAQGHPGVDAAGEAFDQAGTHHQLVADDFGVGRGFLEGGEEELARHAWTESVVNTARDFTVHRGKAGSATCGAPNQGALFHGRWKCGRILASS